MDNKFLIIHSADFQVKVRNSNMEASIYENTLLNIENKIRAEYHKTGLPIIYVFVGDWFEYATTNDAERQIVYEHICRLANKDYIAEIVTIVGNHDLFKSKKENIVQENRNSVDAFLQSIKALSYENLEKISYFNEFGVYQSKASNKLFWVAQVLEGRNNHREWHKEDPFGRERKAISTIIEDRIQNGNKPDNELIEKITYDGDIELSESQFTYRYTNTKPEIYSANDLCFVTLFHDMIRDYVIDDKLPLKPEIINSLKAINQFNTPYVFAGDIHKIWSKEVLISESLNDTIYFCYPGSSVQRNAGEGSYMNYPKTFVEAETKVLRQYIYDSDNALIEELSRIKLPNEVTYNTINIVKTVDTNWQLFLDSIPNEVFKIGNTYTNVIVNLNGSFIRHEKDIRDYIIKKFDLNINRLSIVINFDKVIKTTIDDNLLESLGVDISSFTDIVKSETSLDTTGLDISPNDLTSDIQERIQKEFNSILLDESKLHKLFELILAEHKKDFKTISGSEEQSSIISNRLLSIFKEQLEFCLSNNQSYDVHLKDIATTNFMRLGNNLIELNNDGLTRILGANGIGKTTLYHMLYWLIEGKLFADMKNNQKQKNLLHIFNDQLPGNDTVHVVLNADVNSSKIKIERYANRYWKSKTTLDNKKSKNWKKFVDNVTYDVKCTIFKSDDDIKVLTGEEAESFIKQVFGNIPNTILILNHTKIRNILNMKSDELKEMVLEYIGVDYLNKLEDNIPLVKQQLILDKPKKSKIDIIEERNRLDIHKKDLILELETDKKELDNIGNIIIESKNEKELIDKELIDNNVKQQYNNHFETINTKTNELSTIKEQIVVIDSELQGVDTETQFNEEAPKEPTVIIDQQKKLLDISNSNIVDHLSKQDILRQSIKSSIEQFEESIKLKKVTFESKLESIIETISTACTNQLKVLQNEIELKTTNRTEEYTQAIKTKSNEFNQVMELFNGYLTKYNDGLTEYKSIKNKIDNGTCGECKRVLENITPEDVSMWKVQLLQIEESNKLLLTNKTSTSEQATKIREEIDTIKQSLAQVNYVIGNEYKERIDSITILMNEIGRKQLLVINHEVIDFVSPDVVTEYNQLLPIITQLNSIIEQFVYITLSESTYNKLPLSIVNLSGIKLIDEYKQSVSAYEELESNIQLEKTNQTTINAHIIKFSNDYLEALKVYNTKRDTFLDNQQKYIDKLKRKDLLVESSNKLTLDIDTLNLKNNTLELALEEYNNRLAYRTELMAKLDELSSNQDILISVYNNKVSQSNNLANDIRNINTEYENYLKYEADSLIFKYYDKLIKKDFKEIVFRYYRNYLNATLQLILDGLNFRMLWDEDSDLYMIEIDKGNETYRPVQLVSGMQTCFLGLSLIYAIHMLNVKNRINAIFIDEISGVLNDGKSLSEEARKQAENYQKHLVLLLSKFVGKSLYIVDHVIDDMNEQTLLEVRKQDLYDTEGKLIGNFSQFHKL